MLINIAAPKTRAQGMEETGLIVPGESPPLVAPHCRQCRVPVEEFTLDPIASPYYLGIQATCHGKTTGVRISNDHVWAMQRRGDRTVWMF